MLIVIIYNYNYTIPSDNRELQQTLNYLHSRFNYTIPSDNRELQPYCVANVVQDYYTIPSDNRELQRHEGGTYHTHNYTIPSDNRELQLSESSQSLTSIIPYQVITGNYNLQPRGKKARPLYHTK